MYTYVCYWYLLIFSIVVFHFFWFGQLKPGQPLQRASSEEPKADPACAERIATGHSWAWYSWRLYIKGYKLSIVIHSIGGT